MKHRFWGAAVGTALAAIAMFTASAVATTANPEAGLLTASCTGAGDCTAVGQYANAIGFGNGLLLTETNGKWARGARAVLPGNAAADAIPYLSVYSLPQTPLDAAIESRPGMIAVECSSPGNCTAIGNYLDQAQQAEGVLLTETDGKWKPGVEADLPRAMKSASGQHQSIVLNAIDCWSAGNCTAAGTYDTAHGDADPVMFTETDGKWATGVAPRLPLPAMIGAVTSIACPSADRCVATGTELTDQGQFLALIFSGGNHHWTVSRVKLPARSQATILDGSYGIAVSCPSAGRCTIAGSYETTRDQSYPFVLTQTASGFGRAVSLKLPSTATTTATTQEAEVDQLVCPSVDNCSAVGSFTDSNMNSQGLLYTEQNGTWSTGREATVPAPSAKGIEQQNVMLNGLSCSSSGNCVTAGSFYYGNVTEPLSSVVSRETDGNWLAGTTLALPSGSAHVQSNGASSVSCLPATGLGECTIVGGYTDVPANWQGFASSGINGVFNHPTEMHFPGLDHLELIDSLLSVLRPTGTSLSNVRRQGGHTFDYTAPERGKVTVYWHATVNHVDKVIGTGSAHVSGQGIYPLRLKLNATGRRLVASVKQLKVYANAYFKAYTGIEVGHGASFTLRPEPTNHGEVIEPNRAQRLRARIVHRLEHRHL